MSRERTGARPEQPVALVTGGSGGLGQALAMELDALGCRVAVHYNSSKDRARAVADKLTNDSVVIGGDVASYEAVTEMYAAIREALGPVDVLVNNGAIRRDGLMAMQDPADWRAVIETNLIGPFHTARVCVGHMLRQRWGRVINIVSPSGIIATAGQTAYGASKSGVIGFTRTLAAECGRRGVTVNALSPGFMITDMTKDLPDQVMNGIKEKAPIPRFGTTEEVARSMALFLDGDYMTGQVISIDGGVSVT
ncbi:3-oxoacyl-[acyl-carrier-protein] reductase [Actinokineospora alba]|uniref:3-oxoacyl-[acyl-carrier-protein] reductase n=1 Tax=Actinokineospora alba TaxID=504798 RepID=A0A1H0M801_9PSEU|nr:3-oxoacyl-ACP reductase family protein [Actinokineospora alba]TDP67612.1 3-oxoacyl-[acyl-carrier-protein] reductase [Actinokineospora alba]SDI44495.1 3-oxoacyl-[acyl-carrier protein] reductase [Actinokineospora alba]SDO76240.1 3-oxoacyl-[acyl-carrier-protein] reductase [Actinokineospora alba]